MHCGAGKTVFSGKLAAPFAQADFKNTKTRKNLTKNMRPFVENFKCVIIRTFFGSFIFYWKFPENCFIQHIYEDLQTQKAERQFSAAKLYF